MVNKKRLILVIAFTFAIINCANNRRCHVDRRGVSTDPDRANGSRVIVHDLYNETFTGRGVATHRERKVAARVAIIAARADLCSSIRQWVAVLRRAYYEEINNNVRVDEFNSIVAYIAACDLPDTVLMSEPVITKKNNGLYEALAQAELKCRDYFDHLLYQMPEKTDDLEMIKEFMTR